MRLRSIFDHIAQGVAILCCDATGQELFHFSGFGEAGYDPYKEYSWCLRCSVDFFYPNGEREIYVQLDEVVEDYAHADYIEE